MPNSEEESYILVNPQADPAYSLTAKVITREAATAIFNRHHNLAQAKNADKALEFFTAGALLAYPESVSSFVDKLNDVIHAHLHTSAPKDLFTIEDETIRSVVGEHSTLIELLNLLRSLSHRINDLTWMGKHSHLTDDHYRR